MQLMSTFWAHYEYSTPAVGIRTIRYYQLGRVTVAPRELYFSSQTKVRELFRMAHQV